MNRSNVLPTLLGQRNQKVDSLDQIGLNMLFLHGGFADGDLDVNSFFKLEFDGSFKSIVYLADVITLSDGLWGLAALHKGSAHGSDDGLHQGVRGEEDFIFS